MSPKFKLKDGWESYLPMKRNGYKIVYKLFSDTNQDMIHFQRINEINDRLKMADDLNHIWEILTLDGY